MPRPFEELADRAWDVVVIGAGVAGSVLARELARDGLHVLLVEKKRFPRAKVCGACLNGLAVSLLQEFGLYDLIRHAGAVELHEFHARRGSKNLRIPIATGLAISRSTLDTILAQAAAAAGATFCPETTASVGEITANSRQVHLETNGQKWTTNAKIVVYAGGLGSFSMEEAGQIQSTVAKHSKIGAGCILEQAPAFYQPDVIYMAVGRAGYVGLVRVENSGLDIAAAFDPALLKNHHSLASAAAAVLEEAGFEPIPDLQLAKWQGTPALTRRTRPIAIPRLFLVGDSAGYVEPFTGEGMGWALLSVRKLKPIVTQAVALWNDRFMMDWEHAYTRSIGRRQGLCRSLAATLARPRLSAFAFHAARLSPAISAQIVRRINAPEVRQERLTSR